MEKQEEIRISSSSWCWQIHTFGQKEDLRVLVRYLYTGQIKYAARVNTWENVNLLNIKQQ